MGRSETSINMSRRTTEFNSRCVSDGAIEKMKVLEAPQFKQGKLIMQKPLRHCIPRCKFYYNSDEWFNATDVPKDRQTSSLLEQMHDSQRMHDKAREQKLLKRRRSCSTSETPKTVTTTLPPKALEDEDSEEYKHTFNVEVPSKPIHTFDVAYRNGLPLQFLESVSAKSTTSTAQRISKNMTMSTIRNVAYFQSTVVTSRA